MESCYYGINFLESWYLFNSDVAFRKFVIAVWKQLRSLRFFSEFSKGNKVEVYLKDTCLDHLFT